MQSSPGARNAGLGQTLPTSFIYIRSTEPGDAGRELAYSGQIDQVAFSPDGKLLAMTGTDPIMTETDGNLGQPRATGQSEPWQPLLLMSV